MILHYHATQLAAGLILGSVILLSGASCRHTTPQEQAAREQLAQQRRQEAATRRAALPPRDPSDGWLRGSLTASDGTRLDFRIEKKRARGGSATGGVVALHPNGERFTGTYTGILPSATGRSYVQLPSGQWAWVNTRMQSNTANAIATLSNTNGTTIQLSLTILAGFTPHGIGGGQDNRGVTYQVQF